MIHTYWSTHTWTDSCNYWHWHTQYWYGQKKRDALSHAVFLTAVSRWNIQGMLPTHLWLFLLDKLQNLVSEPIILGPCISENIDERTRKRNFQGNFYSSNTHFRTITTTLLRSREEKKKPHSYFRSRKERGVLVLTGGLRSSRIEQALFALIFCQFAMGLTTLYMRKWKRYKVMWTWKKNTPALMNKF